MFANSRPLLSQEAAAAPAINQASQAADQNDFAFDPNKMRALKTRKYEIKDRLNQLNYEIQKLHLNLEKLDDVDLQNIEENRELTEAEKNEVKQTPLPNTTSVKIQEMRSELNGLKNQVEPLNKELRNIEWFIKKYILLEDSDLKKKLKPYFPMVSLLECEIKRREQKVKISFQGIAINNETPNKLKSFFAPFVTASFETLYSYSNPISIVVEFPLNERIKFLEGLSLAQRVEDVWTYSGPAAMC